MSRTSDRTAAASAIEQTSMLNVGPFIRPSNVADWRISDSSYSRSLVLRVYRVEFDTLFDDCYVVFGEIGRDLVVQLSFIYQHTHTR